MEIKQILLTQKQQNSIGNKNMYYKKPEIRVVKIDIRSLLINESMDVGGKTDGFDAKRNILDCWEEKEHIVGDEE